MSEGSRTTTINPHTNRVMCWRTDGARTRNAEGMGRGELRYAVAIVRATPLGEYVELLVFRRCLRRQLVEQAIDPRRAP
jgi:hypothetical protein